MPVIGAICREALVPSTLGLWQSEIPPEGWREEERGGRWGEGSGKEEKGERGDGRGVEGRAARRMARLSSAGLYIYYTQEGYTGQREREKERGIHLGSAPALACTPLSLTGTGGFKRPAKGIDRGERAPILDCRHEKLGLRGERKCIADSISKFICHPSIFQPLAILFANGIPFPFTTFAMPPSPFPLNLSVFTSAALFQPIP